jgi:hypothetical protein
MRNEVLGLFLEISSVPCEMAKLKAKTDGYGEVLKSPMHAY